MGSGSEVLLRSLTERQRDEVVAAWAALEYGGEPVPEIGLAALRDATSRQILRQLLDRSGRVLVRVGGGAWTTGYRDDVAARLAAEGWGVLPPIDRAVLTLVIVHSVAIPKAEGRLVGDTLASPHPTTQTHLRRLSQLRGQRQVSESLGRLRAAGLVRPVRGADPAGTGAAYVPGPALHRLTPAARRRLQENLILAVGPDTALATSVRLRRAQGSPGDRP
ncbi:MAG: hypothetical protein HKP61_03540 [Dactylosporangium sp.]|nr:hypothetical protein [Dactylosporangium sp.]NNJ60027.1 hypothetical protein [Dactylosporangium sp.]